MSAAFTEDQSSVHSTHVQWFTDSFNSSSSFLWTPTHKGDGNFKISAKRWHQKEKNGLNLGESNTGPGEMAWWIKAYTDFARS